MALNNSSASISFRFSSLLIGRFLSSFFFIRLDFVLRMILISVSFLDLIINGCLGFRMTSGRMLVPLADERVSEMAFFSCLFDGSCEDFGSVFRPEVPEVETGSTGSGNRKWEFFEYLERNEIVEAGNLRRTEEGWMRLDSGCCGVARRSSIKSGNATTETNKQQQQLLVEV